MVPPGDNRDEQMECDSHSHGQAILRLVCCVRTFSLVGIHAYAQKILSLKAALKSGYGLQGQGALMYAYPTELTSIAM